MQKCVNSSFFSDNTFSVYNYINISQFVKYSSYSNILIVTDIHHHFSIKVAKAGSKMNKIIT